MGPVVPEPDALGQPLSEGFYPRVSSNPSTIKHHQPKCISNVRVCQWQRVQQKKKYVLRTVHGYPRMGK